MSKDNLITNKDIVVSLTTFPGRLPASVRVIKNMLFSQTRKPNKVVVNLSRDEFTKGTPEGFEELIPQGLTVNWVDDNLKPANKWYSTLQDYKDSLVVIVDDDVEYPDHLIERLLTAYDKNPRAMVAGRAHRMRFSGDSQLLPYGEWDFEVASDGAASHIFFATGVGGILVDPSLFDAETFNAENIKKLTPHQDDVWLKVMAIRNDIPVMVASDIYQGDLNYIDNSQEVGLWFTVNEEGSGNDEPLRRLMDGYNMHATSVGMNVGEDELRPLVSVVVPAYNAESYISKAVEGIIDQKMRSFECIVVDDGSQDGTVETVRRSIEGDERFSLITQPNQGVSVARNTGLSHARGDYVLFLDADDLFDPYLLKNLYATATRNDSQITICGYNVLSDRDGSIGYDIKSPLTDKLPKGVFSSKSIDFIFNFGILTVWNKLFKRSFLDEYSLEFDSRIRRSQDLLFVGSALAVAESVVYLDQPLITYRSENEKSNMGQAAKYPTSFIESLDALKSFLDQHGLLNKLSISYDNLLVGSCLSYLELYEDSRDVFEKSFMSARDRFLERGIAKRPRDYFFLEDKYETVMSICSGEIDNYLRMRLSWQKKYSLSLTHRLDSTENRRVEEKEYYIRELEGARRELEELRQKTELVGKVGVKEGSRVLAGAIKRKIKSLNRED